MTAADGAEDTSLEATTTPTDNRPSPSSDLAATLNSSATAVFSAAQRAGAEPKFIGPYQLIRTLGEGGMVQVWLAEQTEPIHRQVALKLIRVGSYDNSVLQRFYAERQSLAIMDHPCIAKVFDAGATPDGQPYFVMEYVPGQPITNYCDRKQLRIRERLELFVKVCEGVQHAHQKAVMHRDLKPGNILVASLAGRKKYTEAEPLLLKRYRGMLARRDHIAAPDRYRVERAHQWLVKLYNDWGRPDKAADVAKKSN